jgi:surfeit locus 1 family protein
VWSLLRRPRWLVGTVVCLLLAAVFVDLGFWQLRRLDEKRDRNALVEQRTAEPVAPLEEVDGPLAYRRVTAEGRFDPSGQVLVRNRSLNESPGRWVLTPLVLHDGTAVAVNRGFVPNGVDPPAPPTGEVDVEGLLLTSETRGSIGPRDPAEGRLDELVRADVGRLQQQYDRELFPLYLQQTDALPPGELPLRVPPPELDEGPHLGYAVQWFLFALVALVIYALAVRKRLAEPGPHR